MNIPQMKMQELMDQSDEKKWQLVWGQVRAREGRRRTAAQTDARRVPPA